MEVIIQLDTPQKQLQLFGTADCHLKMLRKSLGVQISAREANLVIKGKSGDVNRATEVIDKMEKLLIKNGSITTLDVKRLIRYKRINHR